MGTLSKKRLIITVPILFFIATMVSVFYFSIQTADTQDKKEKTSAGDIKKTETAPVYDMSACDSLYYGEKLDSRLKHTLFHIYSKISANEKEIELPSDITSDELERIMYIIQFDCPELFNVDVLYNYTKKSNKITTLKPIYTMTAEEYKEKLAKVREVAAKIIKKTKKMTDYEAEIHVHDRILSNTSYDLDDPDMGNIYGCLVKGKANCKGYSNAFQYLMRMAGVPCGIIIGEVKSDNSSVGHSWNIIEICGGVYYTDICWDDVMETDKKSKPMYHYAFFNMTYKEMISGRNIYNHIKFFGAVPKSSDDKYSYCKRNGIYASSYKEAEKIIRTKLPDILSSNKNTFMIKCKNKEILDKLARNITAIIERLIREKCISIDSCSYMKIDNGNMLIIYEIRK